MPTTYELEREANIARNKALLEKLSLTDAVAELGIPSSSKKGKDSKSENKAKPVQPRKRALQQEETSIEPRRASARLRRTGAAPLNETPEERAQREKEEEERRAKEAEEQLLAEEAARLAKRPRHYDLDLDALAEGNTEQEELPSLRTTLSSLTTTPHPRKTGERDAFVFDDDTKEDAEVTALRDRLQGLKVVSRAKVTQDRIYSAAYHPEVTKDLIFVGDKHGQLGIWDARAPVGDSAEDDEDDERAPEERENGKYWRLQTHWPATSKSSISSIKFDPLDAHSLYTSAYDCTIRHFSFASGLSREVFHADETLISAIDLTPDGHEMWIADALGGLTHLDLREDSSKAIWYGLSDQKIGGMSINPVSPHLVLTASNSRALRIWDTRKLQTHFAGKITKKTPVPIEFGADVVDELVQSKKQQVLRGEWRHGKSVSAAYWDPRGRSIVSTSYDDTLRVWDFKPQKLDADGELPSMRPLAEVRHNCQTGKWLTIFRAQWNPNPDVLPHFTVGNMDHSLDIFSGRGDVLARLSNRSKITAVQAVTASHPSIVERAFSGNASGRCVLWAPPDEPE